MRGSWTRRAPSWREVLELGEGLGEQVGLLGTPCSRCGERRRLLWPTKRFRLCTAVLRPGASLSSLSSAKNRSSSHNSHRMSYQSAPAFNSSSNNLLGGQITADEELAAEEGRATPRPTTTPAAAAPPTSLGSIQTSGISSNQAEQSIWQQSA